MATLDRQRNMDNEENPEEKSDKVRILVLLGLDNGDSKSRSICHIFNLDREDTINFIFTAPTEIPAESAACVYHNELYTVGVGSEFSELWRWSVEKDDWKRLADLPSGRRRHCATCVGEKIYVLGGWVDADKRTLDSILCYDIYSNTWIQVTQLYHAVHSAACVPYKHFIYVFGGLDKDDESVNHVQVCDTSTGQATLSSNPMPDAWRLMRAVPWGSKALLIGCWTCYIYDFELNFWEERMRFNTDAFQFGLTLNDGKLYISGGDNNSMNEHTEIIWTFTDEVKSLSVDDFISDNQQAKWKHHNKISHPAVIHSYSEFGLERDVSKHPSIGMTHVDVELNGEMRGMTVVGDRLFVVPSEDPVVNVYDAHSLRALYAIDIPDMKDPQDLAGCSHNKVLYISDKKLQCIHRIIIAGGHLNKLWVRENYFPFYLSVTSEHNLLVSTYARGSEPECILLEYTTEGLELREIKLDSSIKIPCPIRELSNDEFLICHSYSYRLCVINSDGQIIRSYDGEAEKAPYKLTYPRSITVDKKRELVFLTDVGNNRADMFSTNMTHISQIQVASQKSRLMYIYFDAANDILFIDASTQRFTGNQMGAIRGLTVVDDQLFVVHDNHESKINVFDSFIMVDQPPMYVPGMKNPQDFVGCSHNKVLYVSDRELECIHRVNIMDKSVRQWKMRENFKPCGLSITSKNNVLITLQRFSDEIKEYFISTSKNRILPVDEKMDSRVVEYTSEGQILREIKLDTNVKVYWQAVQLNNDQFLICYASTFPRFSVINSAGQIIRDYNIRKEEEEDDEDTCMLVHPHSVTLYKNRELILASDQVHNRVEIFSTDLTYIGPIQSSRQFLNPTCAYIDTSSDRLFVGERSGRVVICLMEQQLLEIKKQPSKK